MQDLDKLVTEDTSRPVPANRALVPYKRVNAVTARLSQAGAGMLGVYATSRLAIKPAIGPLLLGGLAAGASATFYLKPVLVGDVVAGKIVAFVLLLAVFFQLVVACVRSLCVPIIGFGLGFAGLGLSNAGLLPLVDIGVFHYLLIVSSLGVVARCVWLHE